MRAVVQRVTSAAVEVSGETIGNIGCGLVSLVAVGHGDGPRQAEQLADKIVNMRIFADADGRFDLSARDVGAEVLVISQFTLYADTRKGRRPNFVNAAPPEQAEPLVAHFASAIRKAGLVVATGRFGATMLVRIFNDGPVTLFLEVN